MPKLGPADTAPIRTGRGRRAASTLAEINVIPLVDVMLVLLIIFMVTAPMIQRGIEVNLPVSRRAGQVEGERVFVTVPSEYRAKRVVYLGDEPVRADILEERVRQRMEGAAKKEVYLQGDGAVQLQDLMDVIDRLKGAGVQAVGIVTQPPPRR
jgi:biopolymer transport protein ExbD/biopolymer transport protein TolR